MQQATHASKSKSRGKDIISAAQPGKSQGPNIKLYDVLHAAYEVCLLLRHYLPPLSLLSLYLATGVRQVLPHKGVNITLILRILSETIPPSEILSDLKDGKVLLYSRYLSFLMNDHPATPKYRLPDEITPEYVNCPNPELKKPGIQFLKINRMYHPEPPWGTPEYAAITGDLEKFSSKYTNVRACECIYPPPSLELPGILAALAGHTGISTWVIADGYLWFLRGTRSIEDWAQRKAEYYAVSCRGEMSEGLWVGELMVMSVNRMVTEHEDVKWAKWIKVPVYVDE